MCRLVAGREGRFSFSVLLLGVLVCPGGQSGWSAGSTLPVVMQCRWGGFVLVR